MTIKQQIELANQDSLTMPTMIALRQKIARLMWRAKTSEKAKQALLDLVIHHPVVAIAYNDIRTQCKQGFKYWDMYDGTRIIRRAYTDPESPIYHDLCLRFIAMGFVVGEDNFTNE